MSAQPTSPIRSRHGETALAAALFAIAVLLGAADLSGAALTWSAPIGLDAAGRFLVAAVRQPSDPAAGWPHPTGSSAAGFSAVAFWMLFALVTLLPLGAGGLILLRFRRGRTDRGFASEDDVRQIASLAAARRGATVTRPSLAEVPRRQLAGRDVGYRLGFATTPRRSLGRGIPLVASWEHSLLLVAPPGSGKTLRVLGPILRDHPGPALATSTKPDLYELSAKARSRVGPTFALDPERLCPGADPLLWSPVAGCEDTRVAERRASALVAATGEGSDVRGGSFFRRSAAAVLAAYLHAAALDGATMREVVRWSVRPHDPYPLRVLSSGGDGIVDWAARLAAHTSGAEETTSGVVRTVDLALACFSDPDVLAWTAPASGATTSLEKILSEGGTVFALGKDRGALGGTGPLVTAFCDEMITTAEMRGVSLPGRRVDPPLLCCFDEAPSIAPLPSLPALVADGRGRGIVVLVAMQSFSQAEAKWGKSGAATIRNAASIVGVFGALSVAGDLEELAKLSGTRLVERLSFSESGMGREHVARHLVEEPVLSPAEIRSLPPGTALLLWGRLPPLLAHLPGLWEGPDHALVAAEERAARARNDAARAALDRAAAVVIDPTSEEDDDA